MRSEQQTDERSYIYPTLCVGKTWPPTNRSKSYRIIKFGSFNKSSFEITRQVYLEIWRLSRLSSVGGVPYSFSISIAESRYTHEWSFRKSTCSLLITFHNLFDLLRGETRVLETLERYSTTSTNEHERNGITLFTFFLSLDITWFISPNHMFDWNVNSFLREFNTLISSEISFSKKVFLKRQNMFE